MKNYDFQEKHLQISDPIESFFNALLHAILGMVDVFLDVRKYLKEMTIKFFSYFVD